MASSGVKGIGVVVLIIVVTLAAGSYWVTRPPGRGLTSEELTWVRDYIEWRDVHWEQIFDAYETIDADLTNLRVDVVFRPIEHCSRSYDRGVGTAPDNLTSVEDATRDACSLGEQAILEFDSSGLSALRSMPHSIPSTPETRSFSGWQASGKELPISGPAPVRV